MKRIFLFGVVSAMICAASFAQYMPTKVGTVLIYELKDSDGKVVGTFEANVSSVDTDADGIITSTLTETEVSSGETFNVKSQTSSYTFNPADKLTTRIDLTADEFKRISLNMIREAAAAEGQYLSEDNMAMLDSSFKPKGQLSIPLPENAEAGASFPNSSIRGTLMTMNISMKFVKGKYEGYEDIEVPAGKFHCLKVTYTMTETSPGGSENTKITGWYAPNIGLVKEVMSDKKDKELAVQTLQSIKE